MNGGQVGNLEKFPIQYRKTHTSVKLFKCEILPIRFRIHSQTDAGRTAAGFVDEQVTREYCATHRVVMTHTHTHYRKTEKNRTLHGEDSIVVSTVNDSECK